MGDREEALIQKAKEVREGLIEMAKQEIDASHIEVGVITAVDAGNSLVVIMIGGTNRLVPFTGHDASEFVVGEYWAVIFDDDYGTIRLGWWVSAAGGGGVRPVTPHKDTHKSGGIDAFAAVDLHESIIKRLQETGGPTTLLMGVVADGQYLKRTGAGIVGIEGPIGGGLQAIFWHVDGALAIGTEVGEARVLPQDMTFVKAYIYCKTTGTAGSTIADIHKNGVTIYTAQGNRPTLAWNDPDKKAVTVAPDITAGLEGDIMTIDIDAIATGAEDLVIVLIFVGPVGGFPYGSCYGNHIAWVQAAAVQNTWYNISDADIADGELNGVVHDGSGKLTVTEPGDYLILYSLCYEDDIAKDHLEVGIEINGSGAAEPAGQTHSENKFANEMEHLGGGTILNLAAGDTVEVSIRTIDAGAPDITIIAMNLSVCRVGVGGWPGTIEIQEDDAKIADADVVNFEGGGGKVTDEGGGKVTVDITGAGGAWTLIQDVHLAAPAVNIDFLAIAATYKHLKIIASLRSDVAAVSDAIGMRYNNDGGNNYDYTYQASRAAGPITAEGVGVSYMRVGGVAGATAPANIFDAIEVLVPDYLDTSNQKTCTAQGTTKQANVGDQILLTLTGGWWRNAAAINRITLIPVTGANFVAGSRASLYGIS